MGGEEEREGKKAGWRGRERGVVARKGARQEVSYQGSPACPASHISIPSCLYSDKAFPFIQPTKNIYLYNWLMR